MKVLLAGRGLRTGVVLFILLLPVSSHGDTLPTILHLRGATDTSRLSGWGVAGIGDVNNDGFDDVAVGVSGEGKTYVYYGGSPPDTIPDLEFPHFFYMRIDGSVDLNGDGFSDFIGATGHEILIYYGNSVTLDTIPGDTIHSDLPVTEGFGLYTTVGDFDGDGKPDLVVIDNSNNWPEAVYRVLLYRGACGWNAGHSWAVVAADQQHDYRSCVALDLDANGVDELVVGVLGRSYLEWPGQLLVFRSYPFGSIPDEQFSCPPTPTEDSRYDLGYQLASLGDVNGDGYDDLGAPAGAIGFVFFGGPGVWDSIPEMWLSTNTYDIAGAGDINQDGFDDIIVGDIIFRDGQGRVEIFLGGATPDRIMDYWMQQEDFPPASLHSIGHTVSAAGDIDGNGSPDVIIGALDFPEPVRGAAFVLGLDPPTGVIHDEDGSADPAFAPTRPEFSIRPNPAPDGATLSILVTSPERVSVRVFDILGRRRAEIWDGELCSGRHEFIWQGTGIGGVPLASGVYFAQLSSGGRSVVRRIVLLR